YRIHHEGYQVQAIDTTGAGDAFIGAIIYCMLESRYYECKDLFKEKGKDILAFSNRVAALTTTKHGAIESLPTKEDIKDYY
ncbi:MAG: PfkB family carbohydrate kinase, partial [Staphylococcus epidermidis]|nr:PfkB family carbohydrate kinase [Staphylococcus epidermidis]